MDRLPDELHPFFVPGVVDYDADIEGQKIGRRGEVRIGPRCGPDRFNVRSISHEMAHLVEIDDRRATSYGWGLRIKSSLVIGGNLYFEPLTTQATERELRVIAYEFNALKAWGLEHSIDRLTESLMIMPDFTLLPGRTTRAGLVWCQRRVEKLVRQRKYSYASFVREWWRKIELIRRRLKRRRQKSAHGSR